MAFLDATNSKYFDSLSTGYTHKACFFFLLISSSFVKAESVSYDLLDKKSEITSPQVESLVSSEPSSGSGVFSTDFTLTRAERMEFAQSVKNFVSQEERLKLQGVMRNGVFFPFGVIYPEDRRAVENTTAFPSSAVVQFAYQRNVRKGYSLCSGALISSDLVLTAAHCLLSSYSERPRNIKSFRIYPARNGAVIPFGRCGVKKIYFLKNWLNGDTQEEKKRHDLGAIRLDCEIGKQAGWFGVEVSSRKHLNKEIIVQGYAPGKLRQRVKGRQWISPGRIDRFSESLGKGLYRNDTSGGTSGSPVFISGENKIFGVHTDGLFKAPPLNEHNSFTKITPEWLSIIKQWIRDKDN